MLSQHTLQSSRFELKYLIDENCARGVRDFVSSYLEPDEHAAGNPNHEYAVHSLYLDSADLALCRATQHGERNRFKLRIRFYNDREDQPAYFEIKRRLDSVICKQRAAVRRPRVLPLLAGHLPSYRDLHEPTSGQFGSLERFNSLSHRIGAQGQVFVSYIREAYVTPKDNSVRVTFDRKISATGYDGAFVLPDPARAVYPAIGGVVLEVKFTDRFPSWLSGMVRVFDLQRRSMAKYVACVQALHRPGRLVGRIRRSGPVEVQA
ncbi:MAG TPA: polyphosphate polymerase domain-containing protein [Phycisphaerae bacterium]|nr:polyphosphate polymerase domain-containing protein [Phycisphaerae bacterium]HUU23172.1 polyphosphate polymerase domain-containing protein [Phycisphaerae bacterium]